MWCGGRPANCKRSRIALVQDMYEWCRCAHCCLLILCKVFAQFHLFPKCMFGEWDFWRYLLPACSGCLDVRPVSYSSADKKCDTSIPLVCPPLRFPSTPMTGVAREAPNSYWRPPGVLNTMHRSVLLGWTETDNIKVHVRWMVRFLHFSSLNFLVRDTSFDACDCLSHSVMCRDAAVADLLFGQGQRCRRGNKEWQKDK